MWFYQSAKIGTYCVSEGPRQRQSSAKEASRCRVIAAMWKASLHGIKYRELQASMVRPGEIPFTCQVEGESCLSNVSHSRVETQICSLAWRPIRGVVQHVHWAHLLLNRAANIWMHIYFNSIFAEVVHSTSFMVMQMSIL